MSMLDNEIESTESEVSSSPSSEAPESSSESSAESAKQASSAEKEIDWSKAFEHPRFKELVGQKNDALTKYQEMESRYKTLEQQLSSLKESQPKPQSEFDTLLKDLKGIDPRLAAALEANAKAAEQAKALESRLAQFEKQSQEQRQQAVVSTAISKVNSLHESNKMSDFGKDVVNLHLQQLATNGKLDVSDLKAVESAYNEKLKALRAYEDSLKRATTESYVKDKSKDAAVPASQPKGAPAKAQSKSPPSFKDKDSLKAAVIKSYLKDKAAEQSAANV